MLTLEGLLGAVLILSGSSSPTSLIVCFPLQLIKDCNENVQRMKSTEELIYLSQKIEFECKVSLSIPWALLYPNAFSLFPHEITWTYTLFSSPIHIELLNQNIIHRSTLQQCFPCLMIHVSLELKMATMPYDCLAGVKKAHFL